MVELDAFINHHFFIQRRVLAQEASKASIDKRRLGRQAVVVFTRLNRLVDQRMGVIRTRLTQQSHRGGQPNAQFGVWPFGDQMGRHRMGPRPLTQHMKAQSLHACAQSARRFREHGVRVAAIAHGLRHLSDPGKLLRKTSRRHEALKKIPQSR